MSQKDANETAICNGSFTYESTDHKRDDLNDQNDRDDNADLSIRKILDNGA